MVALFRCTDCMLEFSRVAQLTSHAASAGHKPFRCCVAVCRRHDGSYTSFASESLLTQHMKRAHGKTQYNSLLIFKCPIASCNAGFPIESRLLDHFGSKHKDASIYICHICPKAHLSQDGLDQHLRTESHSAADSGHTGVPSIPAQRNDTIADVPLVSAAQVAVPKTNDHEPARLENSVPIPSVYQEKTYRVNPTAPQHPSLSVLPCTLCSEKFCLPQEMSKHLMEKHSHVQCSICEAEVERQDNDSGRSLASHMALHHRCNICCAHFMNLTLHYSLMHPSLICAPCGKNYTSTTQMNAHCQRYHPRVLQGCSLCHIAERTGQDCPIHRSVNGPPSDTGDVEERDSSQDINHDAKYQTPTSLPIGISDIGESESFLQDQLTQTPVVGGSSLIDRPERTPPEDRLPVLEVASDTREDAFEAGAAQVETTPAVEHAANVPDDRECASSLAVSDCSGSWSEVSSVRSEDFSAAVGVTPGISEAEATAENEEMKVDSAENGSESTHDALAVVLRGQPAHKANTPKDTPPAQPQAARTPAEAQTPPPAAAPPATLTCKACSKSPATPVITMCGHVFCHGCILKALATTLACPACYRPILVKLEL